MFAVNRPTIVTTGTRVPRTHGTPPMTAGSTTTRPMAHHGKGQVRLERTGDREPSPTNYQRADQDLPLGSVSAVLVDPLLAPAERPRRTSRTYYRITGNR